MKELNIEQGIKNKELRSLTNKGDSQFFDYFEIPSSLFLVRYSTHSLINNL